jgi:hypothetical protein
MSKKDKGDFMSRAGIKSKEGYRKVKTYYQTTVKPTGIKAGKTAAKSYAKYGKPSVTLGKRLLKWGVVKPVKLALRFPGVGLAATAALYAGKTLGKKWGRGYSYSAQRQFDKRGRKIL